MNHCQPMNRDNSYDRIAHWYDVDMARNMPFDDVAFYVGVSASRGGRVLELGCGNGRILLELLARGIDAFGVDRSARMLENLCAKARARALPVRACRMDVRALGFRGDFAVVLCPYSLVTYMAGERDVSRLLDEVARVLARRGALVIDAFIPRIATTAGEFREDYRRACGGHTLVRSKRIRVLGPRLNCIERRYRLLSTQGELLEQVDTTEHIQTFTPQELEATVAGAGFTTDEIWCDYHSRDAAAEAQFFTIVARKAG